MTPEDSRWLPLAFTDWMPVTQAATLGLATFVQEDVPTVTAAILAGTGRLLWTTGFFGCFLGIWLGDALLYLLARGFGRPLLKFGWARRMATAESIARSEHWFAERGIWLLVSSRFVPGTRLPTYLAAGFLRQPFTQFLLITGLAVAAWTLAIFGLAQLFGDQLSHWLHRWNSSGWVLLLVIALLCLAVRFIPEFLNGTVFRRLRAAGGRWLRWEFWPAWLFYLPVGLCYARLALKYRGLTLPSAANPGITTGGLVGESKFETLRELYRTSPEFTAETWLIEGGDHSKRWECLHQLMVEQGVAYPVILKPDVGQRGVGVKLIHSEVEAKDYLWETDAALVAQRYVPGPLEVGVFYYRFPHEPSGHIFAITEKIFPMLIGDGIQTVEQLVWQDERARFIADRYLARFASRRNETLAKGESLRLVESGNHAQGCVFRDGSHLTSVKLEACIDDISQRLSGFFIGRYDLRFESEEDLRAGRNFQILELNGASAEATSIYDARNSLRAAYATLFRQWELVFAIGAANRTRGVIPTAPGELIRVWRAANRLIATYPAAD